ncbi:MAG: hypothetical protein H6626_14355 [Pseudobdellovibrionaceae bacterium]|nr:hypothetical protein [Bdellovibrionales bacterium]USN47350.1 MAG: hypothetical protein H6626_14355 [Pseudobdellovibrionaceae bacterium]
MVSRPQHLDENGQVIVEVMISITTIMLFVYLAFSMNQQTRRSLDKFQYTVERVYR